MPLSMDTVNQSVVMATASWKPRTLQRVEAQVIYFIYPFFHQYIKRGPKKGIASLVSNVSHLILYDNDRFGGFCSTGDYLAVPG